MIIAKVVLKKRFCKIKRSNEGR